MENDKFKNLSERQKRQKLKFILKAATQGYLSDAELSEIVEKVKMNRQYGIKLYFEASEFESALRLTKACIREVVLGEIIFDEITGTGWLKKKENPSAVIIRNAYEGSECDLCIYIPKDRRQKGKKQKDTPRVLCQQNCVDGKHICHHIEYRENSLICAFNMECGRHA